MKKKDVPYLKLIDKSVEIQDGSDDDTIDFKFKGINGFLEKKGLTWSTILLIGASFTLLILFIAFGITALITV